MQRQLIGEEFSAQTGANSLRKAHWIKASHVGGRSNQHKLACVDLEQDEHLDDGRENGAPQTHCDPFVALRANQDCVPLWVSGCIIHNSVADPHRDHWKRTEHEIGVEEDLLLLPEQLFIEE